MTNATTTDMDQKTGLYDITNLDKMKTLATHAPEGMKAFAPSIRSRWRQARFR